MGGVVSAMVGLARPNGGEVARSALELATLLIDDLAGKPLMSNVDANS